MNFINVPRVINIYFHEDIATTSPQKSNFTKTISDRAVVKKFEYNYEKS